MGRTGNFQDGTEASIGEEKLMNSQVAHEDMQLEMKDTLDNEIAGKNSEIESSNVGIEIAAWDKFAGEPMISVNKRMDKQVGIEAEIGLNMHHSAAIHGCSRGCPHSRDGRPPAPFQARFVDPGG